MPTYTQANRPIAVTTPLGPDELLLIGMSGHEAISHLFSFSLELMAEKAGNIKFDKLLGQKINIRLALPNNKQRYFSGICNRISQGGRSHGDVFTDYRMEVVPSIWLLTKKAQTRIFQHINVPDILKKVLSGFDVSFEIQGTFHPRDFCVQYRETDFGFISRLMEEEGIFYFFRHTSDGHKMVVANTPSSHPEFDEKSEREITYEEVFGGHRQDAPRILSWEKTQELRSGKYTLWDHCFELPHRHLEAEVEIIDSIAAGTVNHKTKVGNNSQLEIYDYPGAYAQRFDGVNKGGGEQLAELQKIFEDNKRTTKIRMQAETIPGLVIQATSNCRHLVSGYQFKLDRHFDADGQYVLTGIRHAARITSDDYRSGAEGDFEYQNQFTCIPVAALPFRPTQSTPKPIVTGTQTAVVVGPRGEEIFTDKYGRVKVQFHWDRQGKNDADSSCWVRVGQFWAGKRWGASFWPRIGQEVIVDFLEGDPDQPIIVGSVYNADQMPPYLGQGPDANHPNDNKLSGIKTNSTKGGQGFNELRFDDTKSKEQVFIHAERNMDQRVKNDSMERIIGNRHLIVGAEKDGKKSGDQLEKVYQDKHLKVDRNHIEEIGKNQELMIDANQDIVVKGNKLEKIGGENDLHIVKDNREKIDGSSSLKVARSLKEKIGVSASLEVGTNQNVKVGMTHALEAGMTIHLKAGMSIVIESGVQLTLKCGANFIDLSPAGIAISGMPFVLINSGGAPGSGPGANPEAPDDAKDAKEANPTVPNTADDAKTGQKSAPG